MILQNMSLTNVDRAQKTNLDAPPATNTTSMREEQSHIQNKYKRK